MKKFLEESGCGIATWIEHVFFNIAVICLKLAIKLALLLLGQNSLCNELNLQHLHGPFNSSFTSMLKRTQHIKTIKFQQTFLQIFLPCLEKIMPAISCLANRDFAFSTDLCRGNKVGQDYKCSDRRCEGEKKKKKRKPQLCALLTKSPGREEMQPWASCPHPSGGKVAVHPQHGSGSSYNKTISNDVQVSLKRSHLQGFSSNSWRCSLMLAAHWRTCFPQKRFPQPLVLGRAAGIRIKASFLSLLPVKMLAFLCRKSLSTWRGGKISRRSFLRCTSASHGIKILALHFFFSNIN